MANGPLTRADFVGFAEIAKARQRGLVNMFNGTELKFSRRDAASAARSIRSEAKDIKANLGKVYSKAAKPLVSAPIFKNQIEDFLTQCADVPDIGEIAAAIGGEATANLIAEATPILGVVTSSVKLIKAGKTVADDGYNLYKCGDYQKGFLRGDPVAAAEAVRGIIKRDLGRHSVELAQQATATGAKIAGLFADLGTATTAGIGLANAVATLGLELFYLGLDIKDMRAGNKRLAEPNTLDLTVFEDCPILGCYLLTCSDTSNVANLFVADIGLPGWMDRVELMKKTQMDPLLKIATAAINASRLQLEGLGPNKGTHQQKGYFAKLKSKAMHGLGLS
jgi:hypothetical protein